MGMGPLGGVLLPEAQHVPTGVSDRELSHTVGLDDRWVDDGCSRAGQLRESDWRRDVAERGKERETSSPRNDDPARAHSGGRGPPPLPDSEQHGGDGHAVEEAHHRVLGALGQRGPDGHETRPEVSQHEREKTDLDEDARTAKQHVGLRFYLVKYHQTMRPSLTSAMASRTASKSQLHS